MYKPVLSSHFQHDDYTFDGFIRVHMNLSRPVNLSTDTSNLTLKRAVAKNKSNNRKSIADVFDINTNAKRRISTSDDSGIGSHSSTASSAIFANDPATLMPTRSRKGRGGGVRNHLFRLICQLFESHPKFKFSLNSMRLRVFLKKKNACLHYPTFSVHIQRPSRRLSFYMPKGTYKPLHVTSKTTAREVSEKPNWCKENFLSRKWKDILK